MIGLLNLGSLVLGLLAWILPVVNLMQYKKYDNKNWVTLSIMSISACAISLYFQIFYGYYLINIEVWSALMYTQGAVDYVASLLLFVILILNAITMLVYCNRSA